VIGRHLAAPLLALLMAAAGGVRGDDNSEAEIQYLLDFVAGSGCVFIRNGKQHDPADAADHLRLKYSRGARYVGSAEQFIDRLASESSWTGQTYSVSCEGETEPTGQWLHRALVEYRAAQPPD
jgi:hypothetical protein